MPLLDADAQDHETERQRFFGPIKNVTHELLIRYTQIDYDREIAIIAEINDQGKKKMIGVVRLITDPYHETAEFAIVVADPWQFQGLGKKFTDYILAIARERGVKRVWAKFLADNKPMMNIFTKKGFKITGERDVLRAELDLK